MWKAPKSLYTYGKSVIISIVIALIVLAPSLLTVVRKSASHHSDQVILDESARQVRMYLRCPSTAVFPTLDNAECIVRVTHQGDVKIVRSYVDAQNSFGAMIRDEYVCRLRASSDGYELEYLRMGKDILYDPEGDKRALEKEIAELEETRRIEAKHEKEVQIKRAKYEREMEKMRMEEEELLKNRTADLDRYMKMPKTYKPNVPVEKCNECSKTGLCSSCGGRGCKYCNNTGKCQLCY